MRKIIAVCGCVAALCGGLAFAGAFSGTQAKVSLSHIRSADSLVGFSTSVGEVPPSAEQVAVQQLSPDTTLYPTNASTPAPATSQAQAAAAADAQPMTSNANTQPTVVYALVTDTSYGPLPANIPVPGQQVSAPEKEGPGGAATPTGPVSFTPYFNKTPMWVVEYPNAALPPEGECRSCAPSPAVTSSGDLDVFVVPATGKYVFAEG